MNARLKWNGNRKLQNIEKSKTTVDHLNGIFEMNEKNHSSRHNTELPFVSMHAFRNVDSKLQKIEMVGKKIDGASYDIHTLYCK